jgi:fructosamine-3-kinase
LNYLDAIRARAEAVLGARITGFSPLSGGGLNEAYAIRLADGRCLFLKTSFDAPAGEFATEAAGLRWIADAPDGPRVPDVEAVVDPDGATEDAVRMLILSGIEPGSANGDTAERLGHELAALHRAGAPGHGAPPPGKPTSEIDLVAAGRELFIGPLRLPVASDPASSWSDVYADLRLLPMAGIADARGALPDGGLAQIATLCERLPELAGPAEPPARLHGDLWGGNVLVAAGGAPYLIDPAAYGGHREVDLAMLRLFGGGGGERCLAAYNEVYPLSDGYRERIALWQLFPLLVHAALFGRAYGIRAIEIARRYCR